LVPSFKSLIINPQGFSLILHTFASKCFVCPTLLRILNLQRFLVFSLSFAAKAKRQVLAAPAGSLQPDAKRQAK
jgi:hypothetical protein